METRRTIPELVARYEEYRVSARLSVEQELADPCIKLVGLTHILAHQADAWKAESTSYRPAAAWSWVEQFVRHQRMPKSFNVCVMYAGSLSGLALGRPSHRGSRLRLELIEGNPLPNHPLRKLVVPIITACAEAYALNIGATEVRIMCPVPALVNYYSLHGYHFIPAGKKRREVSFLYKELT
jgi:hypothetical protein